MTMPPAPYPADSAPVRAAVAARYAGPTHAEDHLTAAQRIERGAQAGCVAGAPSFAEYRDGLTRAGFAGITITPTYQVADGVHAAIIRAARP
jgi:hypothetical protein